MRRSLERFVEPDQTNEQFCIVVPVNRAILHCCKASVQVQPSMNVIRGGAQTLTKRRFGGLRRECYGVKIDK